jgi:pimeloyl-ACP methyl ester carboxylesterase
MSYLPLTYFQDVEALIAELKLERFVLFGTSLGGVITMLLALSGAQRIAGALLNDIGPEFETRGLDHIRSYVGRARDWPTWLHAARFIAEAQADRYPDWELDQWLVYAKRLAKLTQSGRIVYDYDMRIAEPFKLPGGESGFDMWPAFRALGETPSLLLRGGLSDLLSEKTAGRMAAELPDLELVTVPRVGHAPTLDEPEAQAAIDRLLERIMAKEKAG